MCTIVCIYVLVLKSDFIFKNGGSNCGWAKKIEHVAQDPKLTKLGQHPPQAKRQDLAGAGHNDGYHKKKMM